MMPGRLSRPATSMDGLLYRGFKRIVPRPVKGLVKRLLRARGFARALSRLESLPAGTAPSSALLEDLSASWGNEGFSADAEYLAESVDRVLRGLGPVLECGSGLSTIVMGVAARHTGVEIWSLEHLAEWADRVRAVLDRRGVRNAHLVTAPLRNFGGFEWYDVPWGALPATFRTVVCDGPPETTPGGRYGLVPIARSRLAPDAVVLIDDATQGIGRAVVDRWSREHGARVELRPTPKRGYAVVTFA
jgi:hypothetical protein